MELDARAQLDRVSLAVGADLRKALGEQRRDVPLLIEGVKRFKVCCVTIPTRSAVEVIGSSVGGSPIVATLMTPPFSCAIMTEGAATRAVATRNANLSLM